MKFRKISRRNFIRLAVCSVPTACIADTFLLEPRWLATRKIDLGSPNPSHRIVHFTDLHYKGDRSYLSKVIKRVNELSPDFVCFTGDIVEDTAYLKEALELLGQIRRPMFGVPGNHDYWSHAPFPQIAACFEATGGAWLVDQETTTPDGKIAIIGATGKKTDFTHSSKASKRLLLIHYPAFAGNIQNETFDLMLAGHSHGGQVRIPFLGALIVPSDVGKYDKGLFQTKAGPLYVNAGIGTWYLPVRFFCRPEITIIEF